MDSCPLWKVRYACRSHEARKVVQIRNWTYMAQGTARLIIRLRRTCTPPEADLHSACGTKAARQNVRRRRIQILPPLLTKGFRISRKPFSFGGNWCSQFTSSRTNQASFISAKRIILRSVCKSIKKDNQNIQNETAGGGSSIPKTMTRGRTPWNEKNGSNPQLGEHGFMKCWTHNPPSSDLHSACGGPAAQRPHGRMSAEGGFKSYPRYSQKAFENLGSLFHFVIKIAPHCDDSLFSPTQHVMELKYNCFAST